MIIQETSTPTNISIIVLPPTQKKKKHFHHREKQRTSNHAKHVNSTSRTLLEVFDSPHQAVIAAIFLTFLQNAERKKNMISSCMGT